MADEELHETTADTQEDWQSEAAESTEETTDNDAVAESAEDDDDLDIPMDLFCALMIIGLIWAVTYYLSGSYPIPNIGAWNLAIAVAIIMVGFLMTMWWR